MLSQLEEEICYVRRESFWAIPVKDSNGGTSVNNRVPKVDFGRREVKHRGDAKRYQTEGLKVRE